ncbi:putative nickel-responsive regulator [subsurface metagenome]
MVKRFGVSLEDELLEKFDTLLLEEGYSNRSEAIRDLIRDSLVRREWEEEESEIAGVAILVYNHHEHELAQKVTDIQHHHFGFVIASMHAHLDEHNCLEVILMRGKAKEIKRFADSLICTRGVKHGQFVATTTGTGL